MNIVDFILLGIALGVDCFAVSLGRSVGRGADKTGNRRRLWLDFILLAVLMGLFQGAMPLISYSLGMLFEDVIMGVIDWLAFVVLAILGVRMIFEKDDVKGGGYSLGEMLLLAVATSIDALACGVLFVGCDLVWLAVVLIAFCSLLMSLTGSCLGYYLGRKLPMRVSWIGGIILIGIGLKVIISHYMI